MRAITERIATAGVAVLVALTIMPVPAAGHLATERFIPLGLSPGLSSENSYIGTIKAFDAATQTITIDGDVEAKTVSLTKATRIWLDRSKIRQTNLVGDPTELLAGRRIEVKFKSPAGQRVADWIKIEITKIN